jgi:hypothetical protein
MERRKSSRRRCRIPCEIFGPRSRASGTILDLSEGGLSIRTELEIDQGESLRIGFRTPDGQAIEVEALLWHSRRVRSRESGEDTWVLGLMLSSACEAYSRLVPGAQAQRPEPPSPSEPNEPDPVEEDDLVGFRIRVKHCVGPRTRLLTLSATSDEEARALAVTHLGGDWEVLEILAV